MGVTVCLLLFHRVAGKGSLVRVINFDKIEKKTCLKPGFKSPCIVVDQYFLEKKRCCPAFL